MSGPIAVTIIGGYLGAGKTTLVNHILRSADERIAVLVNDFGSINIDVELIDSDDGTTISLANGCICCSLVDGFGAALEKVRSATPAPERLVIEASGVADPSLVSSYAHGPGLELAGVITVIDAEQVRRQATNAYIADVIEQQISAADVLVLNKCDLVDAVHLDSLKVWLAGRSKAAVIQAVNGEVPLGILLPLQSLEKRADRLDVSETSSVFLTWTESSDDPFDRDVLEHRLENSPQLVRAKGFVRFEDAPNTRQLVQLVGSRWSITEAGVWRGDPSAVVYISAEPDVQDKPEVAD